MEKKKHENTSQSPLSADKAKETVRHNFRVNTKQPREKMEKKEEKQVANQ